MMSSHGNAFHVTGLCEGDLPVTSGFHLQRTNKNIYASLLLAWTSCWTNGPSDKLPKIRFWKYQFKIYNYITNYHNNYHISNIMTITYNRIMSDIIAVWNSVIGLNTWNYIMMIYNTNTNFELIFLNS